MPLPAFIERQLAGLSERDRKTVQYAAIGIGIYLVLFGAFKIRQGFEAGRADYRKLSTRAAALATELRPYENRILLLEKLREIYHLNPSGLSRTTLVAEASAAIQQAATSGGIQLGPIRESPSRSSARELASMSLEGAGPVEAIVTLLARLETLGFPLLIDSVQLTPESNRPGMVKIQLTIVILDPAATKLDGDSPNA